MLSSFSRQSSPEIIVAAARRAVSLRRRNFDDGGGGGGGGNAAAVASVELAVNTAAAVSRRPSSAMRCNFRFRLASCRRFAGAVSSIPRHCVIVVAIVVFVALFSSVESSPVPSSSSTVAAAAAVFSPPAVCAPSPRVRFADPLTRTSLADVVFIGRAEAASVSDDDDACTVQYQVDNILKADSAGPTKPTRLAVIYSSAAATECSKTGDVLNERVVVFASRQLPTGNDVSDDADVPDYRQLVVSGEPVEAVGVDKKLTRHIRKAVKRKQSIY